MGLLEYGKFKNICYKAVQPILFKLLASYEESTSMETPLLSETKCDVTPPANKIYGSTYVKFLFGIDAESATICREFSMILYVHAMTVRAIGLKFPLNEKANCLMIFEAHHVTEYSFSVFRSGQTRNFSPT